jgi:hypothetical protein
MGAKGLRNSIGAGAALLFAMSFLSFTYADADVEAKVREYFKDAPVMIPIAKCESGFRQFGKGDIALHGGYGGTMIGVYQVSEGVHADFAKAHDMDIYSLEGNLAYARYLYEREGTQPWISSFPCWGSAKADADSSGDVPVAADASLSANLSLGMEHPQVLKLQQLLNGNGFQVAADGPGSSGNETTKFGAFTRLAVRKFQCAKGIACDGDEYSTGYGFVGAKTRTALLGLTGVILATPAPVAAVPETPAATPSGAQNNQAEIAQLQTQIAELTKMLAALLAQRAS